MLNVTIQNDGKIKFQSECSSTKDLRHNINLLLAVVSSMEMEEAVAKKETNGIPIQTTYYLYLDKVEKDNRINTVKVLKDNLNIPLERAKNIVNTAVNDEHNDILLSQSSDSNFLATIKDALESVGCICRITNGF